MKSVWNLIFILFLFIATISGVTVLILWYFSIPLIYATAAPFGAFLLFYFSLPVLFICSSNVQRYFVYLSGTKRPPEEFDYNDTESAGLAGCRNFYLFLENGTEHIGVWHLLPHSLIGESVSKSRHDKFWKDSLRHSGKNVIVYFHGNTGTRALDHRKELYWLLQNADCHIIAFDYRGFADSTFVPTSEETTVEDGILVCNWVREVIGENSETKIFIWGHSLGTGISSHVAARLEQNGNPPAGMILEAPFTNIGDALKHHKKALLYRYLPRFQQLFVLPLHKSGIAYESEKHIENISTPILILHAQDDETVPYSLGEKLFHHGRSKRPGHAHPIHFKKFPKGHGHKLIHTAPDLPVLIEAFMKASLTGDWLTFNCECCVVTI